MKVKSESEVMSYFYRPHGLHPTRLLHPWDFPGKSTGVGCHFLLHHSSLETTYYKNNLSFCQHVKRLKQCDVIYIYEFYLAIKKDILPLVATWMKLEDLMLIE